MKQATDMVVLLGNCVEGYRLAYPDVDFRLELPEQPLVRIVSPDLIVQMLDKLAGNAIDFGDGDKPVEIILAVNEACRHIRLVNYGSTLPDVMGKHLFNSMVSVRTSRQGKEPHLGLGLYIVRLITEFHGGKIHAANPEGGEGWNVIKFGR